MKRFHEHLDSCKRCRDNPFALCSYGARILQEEAGKLGGYIPGGAKTVGG